MLRNVRGESPRHAGVFRKRQRTCRNLVRPDLTGPDAACRNISNRCDSSLGDGRGAPQNPPQNPSRRPRLL